MVDWTQLSEITWRIWTIRAGDRTTTDVPTSRLNSDSQFWWESLLSKSKKKTYKVIFVNCFFTLLPSVLKGKDILLPPTTKRDPWAMTDFQQTFILESASSGMKLSDQQHTDIPVGHTHPSLSFFRKTRKALCNELSEDSMAKLYYHALHGPFLHATQMRVRRMKIQSIFLSLDIVMVQTSETFNHHKQYHKAHAVISPYLHRRTISIKEAKDILKIICVRDFEW